ncbi:hypothetical protein HMPREF1394_01040 [Helicobacter pylori GAM105Ai]|nr:hypothetical protein HMPREF1394_01040 [Helicobacter pylori GAM105Ai]
MTALNQTIWLLQKKPQKRLKKVRLKEMKLKTKLLNPIKRLKK